MVYVVKYIYYLYCVYSWSPEKSEKTKSHSLERKYSVNIFYLIGKIAAFFQCILTLSSILVKSTGFFRFAASSQQPAASSRQPASSQQLAAASSQQPAASRQQAAAGGSRQQQAAASSIRQQGRQAGRQAGRHLDIIFYMTGKEHMFFRLECPNRGSSQRN